MSRMISPSQHKKQELEAMIENGFSGEGDVFREFIKLTVESMLQEALEEERRVFLDRVATSASRSRRRRIATATSRVI